MKRGGGKKALDPELRTCNNKIPRKLQAIPARQHRNKRPAREQRQEEESHSPEPPGDNEQQARDEPGQQHTRKEASRKGRAPSSQREPSQGTGSKSQTNEE